MEIDLNKEEYASGESTITEVVDVKSALDVKPKKSKAQLMRESGITNIGKRKGFERKNCFEFSFGVKEYSTANGQLLFNKVRTRKILIEAAYEFAKHNKSKYSDFSIVYSPKPWNTGMSSINRFNQCQAVEDLVNGKEASNG